MAFHVNTRNFRAMGFILILFQTTAILRSSLVTVTVYNWFLRRDPELENFDV